MQDHARFLACVYKKGNFYLSRAFEFKHYDDAHIPTIWHPKKKKKKFKNQNFCGQLRLLTYFWSSRENFGH